MPRLQVVSVIDMLNRHEVRMDVGDVDDVESDDDSAEDAEPNPTFESPAYTLARTVGYPQ